MILRGRSSFTIISFLALLLTFACPPASAQEDIIEPEEVTAPEKKTDHQTGADNKKSADEAVEEEEPAPVTYNIASLQGLNKVTARSTNFEAPVGIVTKFGGLEIITRACRKSAPFEQPENSVLMEIWELKQSESPKRIFNGWMFSSSPSLSALEHPVYDITVIDCLAKPIVE